MGFLHLSPNIGLNLEVITDHADVPAPAADHIVLYYYTDGSLYSKNSSNTATAIGGGGGGALAVMVKFEDATTLGDSTTTPLPMNSVVGPSTDLFNIDDDDWKLIVQTGGNGYWSVSCGISVTFNESNDFNATIEFVVNTITRCASIVHISPASPSVVGPYTLMLMPFLSELAVDDVIEIHVTQDSGNDGTVVSTTSGPATPSYLTLTKAG